MLWLVPPHPACASSGYDRAAPAPFQDRATPLSLTDCVRTLLYQQTNIEIWWDDQGWLYVDWIGMQTVNNKKNGCAQILRHLQIRTTASVLNDNTRVEGIWIGAAQWVGREWFPQMRRIGLQRFAWVQSPRRLSQVSAEEALKFAPPGAAQLFWSLAEAEAWLKLECSMAWKRQSGQIKVLPPSQS